MAKTRDDFMPDKGGFLDDVDGEIMDVKFDLASGDYADKVLMGGGDAKVPVVVILTIESPDLEKPAVQSYSVGSQDIWEIAADGKSISNIKNPDKHIFREGSRAWSLVEAMMKAIGEGDLEKGQDFCVKRDIVMTDARFYTGFDFHWEVQTITQQIGKETRTGRVTLPVSVNKMPTTTGSASKGKTAGKAAPAPAASPASSDTDDLDLLLAGEAAGKTEKELKTFAVRNPDIKANDAYMKAVVSGKKLRELEANGTLTMDPKTQKYT